jgi:hypothetical protein
MVRKIVRTEPTPNPRAFKCVLDAPAVLSSPGAMGTDSPAARSFRDPASAAGEPLAARLLQVEGVAGLLFAPDGSWISVNLREGADWKRVRPALDRALADA